MWLTSLFYSWRALLFWCGWLGIASLNGIMVINHYFSPEPPVIICACANVPASVCPQDITASGGCECPCHLPPPKYFSDERCEALTVISFSLFILGLYYSKRTEKQKFRSVIYLYFLFCGMMILHALHMPFPWWTNFINSVIVMLFWAVVFCIFLLPPIVVSTWDRRQTSLSLTYFLTFPTWELFVLLFAPLHLSVSFFLHLLFIGLLILIGLKTPTHRRDKTLYSEMLRLITPPVFVTLWILWYYRFTTFMSEMLA